MQAIVEYRAGDPRSLADYVRKHGIPSGPDAEFVADIIEGKFRRTKRDTHRPREIAVLELVHGCKLHYKMEKEIASEHPTYEAQFKSLNDVYDFVANHFHRSRESIIKLEQRARTRYVAAKAARARTPSLPDK